MNKIKNVKYKEILFAILLFLACMQNFSVYKFEKGSIKAYRLFSLIFLPILLKKKKIKFPKLLTIFFAYIFLITILSAFNYGMSSMIINYMFALYIVIIIMNVGNDISKEHWLKIIRTVSTIVISMVSIKILLNYKELLNFLKNSNTNGHPNGIITTFFEGGVNIEATWIAIFGFCFYKNKNGFLYFFVSFLISIIYVSRVGIILNLILFIFLLFQKDDGIIQYKEKIKFRYKLIFVIFATLIMLIFLYNIGMLEYILTRMLNLGSNNDKGYMGRITMWSHIINAIESNPIGYGLGNAVKGIELFVDPLFGEKNVHNIYFQMFLDTGIIGGVFFISLILAFLIQNLKSILKNPIEMSILGYLIAGLVQFMGGDFLAYFLLGIYFALKNQERKENNK